LRRRYRLLVDIGKLAASPRKIEERDANEEADCKGEDH
jgi:hypothetical protein